MRLSSWVGSGKRRLIASGGLIALAGAAVAARYVLFQSGILYGEAAATTASLAVAGVVIAAGYLPLRMLRGGQSHAGGAAKESIVATVSAVLGLALTAYSVSQLLAPNTPVAASVPACAGVPVYGARYFAVTVLNGVNARSGPGPEYQQVSRYPAGCTLGFDGYCIGFEERDFVVGTPDQRWLLVRHRDQLISDAFVLSESAESDLGAIPSPQCARLGGLPQPNMITQFTYNTGSGELRAAAPGAVLVGYSAVTLGAGSPAYHTGALGTDASSGFPAQLPPAQLAGYVQAATGQVLLGAAICLAVGVPVTSSLRAELLTVRTSRIVRGAPDAHVPPDIAARLAVIACNSLK